ncbi:MAG: single-stranded DNA-binding protein [Patescibacteria group bacterium]|jgi:single-strand DNA-binding protein
MDLNRVSLIGNLAMEPEHKTLPSGASITRTSLATSFAWKDSKTKELKEKTDFHTIIGWNKLGERIHQYLKKGDRIYVEGRLDHHSYEGKDGITKYFTNIIAEQLIMLGKGKREVTTTDEPIVTEPVTEPF